MSLLTDVLGALIGHSGPAPVLPPVSREEVLRDYGGTPHPAGTPPISPTPFPGFPTGGGSIFGPGAPQTRPQGTRGALEAIPAGASGTGGCAWYDVPCAIGRVWGDVKQGAASFGVYALLVVLFLVGVVMLLSSAKTGAVREGAKTVT